MSHPFKHLKEDHRPPKGGWADGGYLNTCRYCNCGFIGDKRAWQCADCAYKEPEPMTPPTISTEARKIILRCQKCGRSRSVDRTKSDPVKAVEMVLFCPKCDQPGTFESPAYMDKNGKQIL